MKCPRNDPSCAAVSRHLESGLLALEAAATTAPAKPATSATTSTTAATTTVTEATTAAATATPAEATATTVAETTTATATTTTAAAEATAAVGVTRLGIVETDGPAIEVTAVERVESGLGLLDRGEAHIGKALGTARLPDDTGQ